MSWDLVDDFALVVSVVLGGYFLKLNVTQMEYGSENFVNDIHVLILKPEDLEAGLELLEFVNVSLTSSLAVICQISVLPPQRAVQVELGKAIVGLEAVVHVVEHVKVALSPANFCLSEEEK